MAKAATPASAVEKSLSIKTGYGGLCLKFVRTCYGIPAKHASAKAAWANARVRHVTSDPNKIPVGAPIFLSHPKSKYGHVAIYLGNGLMRTTNSSTNRIHSDSIKKWIEWGYKVDGWTEDLNGVTINGLKVPATPDNYRWLKRGAKGPRVGKLQRGLNQVFPLYSRLVVDESFGPNTEKTVKEFQRRAGLVPDGIVGPLTTAKLRVYGITF